MERRESWVGVKTVKMREAREISKCQRSFFGSSVTNLVVLALPRPEVSWQSHAPHMSARPSKQPSDVHSSPESVCAASPIWTLPAAPLLVGGEAALGSS